MSLTDTYTLKLTEREYSMIQISVWSRLHELNKYVESQTGKAYDDPEYRALLTKLAATYKWRDEK